MAQLRRHVQRKAGRLLAVAQRRVEDDDACVESGSCHVVVAGAQGRSQSDNDYVTIMSVIIATRMDLAALRVFLAVAARAQLLARRGEGAPHAAGGQPGGPPARADARRAAVRSLVEDRHADRRRPHAAELRPAAGAAGRGDRVGDARTARPASRPRADWRQRSGGPHAAAAHGAVPPAAIPISRSTSAACRRGRSPSRCSRAASTSAR